MNEAIVLIVLKRKWGLIWFCRALSSMLVASFFCSSMAVAAIWVESSSPKPLAIDSWVSLMLRAVGK